MPKKNKLTNSPSSTSRSSKHSKFLPRTSSQKKLKPITKISGLILAGIITVLIVPFIIGQQAVEETLASVQETPTGNTDIHFCEENNDCLPVNEGCCSCNQNGRKTAINRKYYSHWIEDKNDSCMLTSCPQVKSDDLTCTKLKARCVNNKCIMK